VGRPYAQSSTPCLLFEAARDSAGGLRHFQCVAGNHAAEARALVDAEGDLIRWAESLEQMLERAACERVVETGEPYTTELYCRPGGTELWWQATAVRHGDGFALWLRDVTQARLEERRAREALALALVREERMEAEAEYRERFIGVLGHDLRNPLNAISFSVHTLRSQSALTPRQQELTLRIEACADRMAKMISGILDLTRARRSGGIPLTLEPTSLSAVCQQVLEELQTAHPDRLIFYEEDRHWEGIWDAERLAQVVSNLVSNALEHGGETVPVYVRCYPRGELVALEVHNPGAPIPPHRLATLFQPFQGGRPPGERKRRSGLGLGLYIVREIVQSHGGRVSVHSAESEGTTFTVLLPRDARQALAEEPRQDEEESLDHSP
jgi:signal transduction histidine kinase